MVEWLNGLAKYVCDAKCFTDDALEFGKNRTGLVCLKMTLVTYSKSAQDARLRQAFQFTMNCSRPTSRVTNDSAAGFEHVLPIDRSKEEVAGAIYRLDNGRFVLIRFDLATQAGNAYINTAVGGRHVA